MPHMPGHFLQKSRHSTAYYFRCRLPDDLRVVLGKHQPYKSLETCDSRHTAINKAFSTRSLPVRDGIDQPIICRENRSSTTTKYNHPSCVRIPQ